MLSIRPAKSDEAGADWLRRIDAAAQVDDAHLVLDLTVIDSHGVMNENAGKYAGLDRFACRKQIVADLEEQGFLEKVEPYQHGVGHCYRCKTVSETTTSEQWFVSVRPLADKAVAAVRDGQINIYPKTWDNTFYSWMDNIRDWCISRQIWWGHRIPAWTCEKCGELIVETSDPTSCPKCGSHELNQETDVLDTWFSSALWPFSTLGWPDKTPELATFYPTSVLITSFDILFFWVARMMMMGLHFMDEVPFHDVYLHALVRDKHGKKMSKSTGNVIDPLEVMATHGTDALRFTLAAFAAQGREIRLDEERIEGYRFFINKIWNAARFALMHLNEDDAIATLPALSTMTLPNRWILSRTNVAVTEVRRALDEYRFNDVASTLYQFVWHEFCDWYLEWIKGDLFGDDQARKDQTRRVLLTVLETTLKLLHPLTPFVSEEIWSVLPGTRDTLMTEPFPAVAPMHHDPEAEKTATLLMGVIGVIRNIRSEMLVAPSARVEAILICPDPIRAGLIEREAATVVNLARLADLSVLKEGVRPEGAAAGLYEDLEVFIPMKGLVDVVKETARLSKDRDKISQDLQRTESKLQNEKFVSNAPAEVVGKERERIVLLKASLVKIEEGMARLAELA